MSIMVFVVCRGCGFNLEHKGAKAGRSLTLVPIVKIRGHCAV